MLLFKNIDFTAYILQSSMSDPIVENADFRRDAIAIFLMLYVLFAPITYLFVAICVRNYWLRNKNPTIVIQDVC